jgi:hypothetical protein
MSSRKQRRAKKKPSPKSLPEPVQAALERKRGGYVADDRRSGGGGGSRMDNAEGRRAAQQHRHQAK